MNQIFTYENAFYFSDLEMMVNFFIVVESLNADVDSF